MSFPDYIVKLVNDVAKHEHCNDHHIESSNETTGTAGLTGKLLFFQLVGIQSRDGNSKPVRIDLVLKTVPSNRNRRQVFQAITGFKSEVEMYTKVLPRFVAFQAEKLATSEDEAFNFPKVYATVFDEESDHFAIVMEDLRTKNYRMSSRLNSTTYEHARLVIAKLAQFHAISFAMKEQQSTAFDEIVRSETLSSKFMKDDLGYEITNVFDRAVNALENEKHKKLIEDLKTTYLEWVDKFSDQQFVGESGVLLHGDCGNNNILFQYNERVRSKLCY